MLTAEQIKSNWENFLGVIKKYVSPERQTNLLRFYETYAERIALMPAAVKHHNAFPGGYVDHVLRVTKLAIETQKIWADNGLEAPLDQVIFVALHHDLGKFGNFQEPLYVSNPSEWHIKNRGELYAANPNISFMSAPDRGLWLLSQMNIRLTEEEVLGIKLHDGLYDEANKQYYITWNAETKLRTPIPYIVHHADLTACQIEFQREFKLKNQKV